MGRTKSRGNGQGTAFKRGSGWTAQVTASVEKDDAGRIVRRRYKTKGGFKTKREALEYCKVLRGEQVGINQSITFAGLYTLWSKAHYKGITKDAENGYRAAYAKCGALSGRVFADLKTADLQALIDGAKTLKGGELSRRGKADIKSLFSNLYNYAMQNDYVRKNYAEYVTLPPKTKSKKDAFTPEERAELWKDYNNGHAFTGYILIMCYTGMRYGEISTIQRENIHLDERYMIGGIKTEAGRNREIPIRNEIAPIIERLLNEEITTDDVTPPLKISDPAWEKLIDIPEKKFYNLFYGCLRRAGVRGLNPHCCRHTCATMLMESGAPAAVVTAIMGHEDISTTMGYTHVKLAEKLEAVNSLPR